MKSSSVLKLSLSNCKNTQLSSGKSNSAIWTMNSWNLEFPLSWRLKDEIA